MKQKTKETVGVGLIALYPQDFSKFDPPRHSSP
jgi:hypothetical protein